MCHEVMARKDKPNIRNIQWTNDSYELIIYSESKTYSANCVAQFMNKLIQFFLVIQNHAAKSVW